MKTWNITHILLLSVLIGIMPRFISAQSTNNVIQLIRESQNALAADKLDEAERLSKSATELDPAHPPAWRQYGIALWRNGKAEQAAAALQRATEMDDKDTTAWRALALAYWKSEKNNEAVRALSTYLRLKPEDAPVWRDLAAWLTRLERGDQAIAALERVVELEPENSSAWRELGSWQTRMKRYEPAVTALQQAVKLKPDDTSAWRGLATALMQLKRYEEAVTALGKTIKIKPDDASTWHDLAIGLTRLERYAPAVDAFKKVTELKPDDASAWHELGIGLNKLERYEPAVDAFKKVTEITPDDASAWRDLAVGLTRVQRYEPAVDAFKKVIGLKPDDASAWHELGLSLIVVKRYEPAIDAFRKAVKLNPENASAWRELALLYERKGDLAAAAEAFQKTLAIRPDDAATRRDLGWVLWKQGKRDEAVTQLTKAVESGVEGRDRVIFQVVARLSEEGVSDQALKFMHRVDPDKPPSVLALALARSGRLRAAAPILAHVWQSGEKTAEVGLYLAYARAVNGEFTELATHLNPLLQSPSKCTAEYAEVALETLLLCSTQPETPALAERLESVIEKNEGYSKQITDIFELSAEAYRLHSAPEKALPLYRRVLERDPERASWVWAVLLAERIERQTPYAWIDAYEKRITSPALREGVKGLRADRQGHSEVAVDALRRSIALNPAQPVLRQVLFLNLLGQGRVDESRAETKWFIQQIEEGNVVLRSYLAEMLTRLGDTREALVQWKLLYKSNPQSAYYGVETAATLYHLGQPDDAMALLKKMSETTPDHRVFELMSEIASARADTTNAFEWASRGLAVDPSQTLLRLHAENLEQMETNAPAALASAREFLAKDPGYVPLTLLEGRMLEAIAATNELQAFHLTQLTRNPVFVPSLKALRNSTLQSGLLDDAVEYSRRRAEVQPGSSDARQDYANSLAQRHHFRESLNLLRPLTQVQPEQMLSVLVYPSPTRPPYAGRNSVIQISRHIRHLSDLGFVFVNAFSQLSETPEERHVMLILIDPEPDVIEALDPILQQYNSRVVYAGNAAVPVLTLSGQPIPERLSPILASGRWQLASGGPSDFSRHSVNNSGVLGNPLTHPLITDQSEETATEFAERLDQELATASQTLKENNERILVYPSGDFGQRSLDFLPDHLDVLHSAVSHHFTHAICFDSCGFYLPSSDTDPLRIPARIVPPDWDENELLTYLTLEHPLTRSWLELARVLCWNGQYEAAHKAFIEAEKAGADPIELNFNHGMNAYWQGDLPTAKTKLQAAQMLDPEAERIRLALARLDDRRRPQVTAYIAGWKDNEDRDHYRYGGYGNMFISERIRLGVAADRDRWKTDGLGSEYGTRLGVQGLAFLAPQVWLTGSIWQLDMDNLDNHWGGDAMLRVPNPLLSGFLGFGVSREEIETVEALRANIDAETYTLRTYTRLIDVFDLYADLKQITRSDGNDTSMLDGRLLYRLQEWPYIGVGWRFRIADSDRDPPEYWAPEQLQQHQLHITVRGAWKRLSGFVSAEAGYADERDTDWRFVWGARSQGNLTLTERLDLTGQIGWSESPDYERLQGRLGLTGQF